MASENNLTAVFTDIANAIRDKKGSVNTIKPVNMADEILTIGDTNFKDLVEGTLTDIEDDTITKICNYAFYYYPYIKNASFTKVSSIGLWAFAYSSIVNAYFPNMITIGDRVMQNCSSLISIDFPNVTSVGNTSFHYCSKLKTVNIPLATSMGNNVFSNCSGLITINFPYLETIGKETFYNCALLTSISLPKLTSMGQGAFERASSLTSVDLPLATSISKRAFFLCSKLANVNIPLATSIGYDAFYSCELLTSVDLPLATSIDSSFDSCSALKTIILRANQVCTLLNSNAFSGTPIATSTTEGYIYVPDDLVESYKVATNWSTYASKIKGLSELPTE